MLLLFNQNSNSQLVLSSIPVTISHEIAVPDIQLDISVVSNITTTITIISPTISNSIKVSTVPATINTNFGNVDTIIGNVCKNITPFTDSVVISNTTTQVGNINRNLNPFIDTINIATPTISNSVGVSTAPATINTNFGNVDTIVGNVYKNITPFTDSVVISNITTEVGNININLNPFVNTINIATPTISNSVGISTIPAIINANFANTVVRVSKNITPFVVSVNSVNATVRAGNANKNTTAIASTIEVVSPTAINSSRINVIPITVQHNLFAPNIHLGSVERNANAVTINSNIILPSVNVGKVYANTIAPTCLVRTFQPTIELGEISANTIASNLNVNFAIVKTSNTIKIKALTCDTNLITPTVSIGLNVLNIPKFNTQITIPTVYCYTEQTIVPFCINTISILPTTAINIATQPINYNAITINACTSQTSYAKAALFNFKFATIIPNNYKANFNTVDFIPIVYVKTKQNKQYKKIVIDNIPIINKKGTITGV